MPLEEYEHLIDAASIVEANKVSEAIAQGRDELVPEAVVERLLAGENPVRVWRSHRGLSARELALKAELSAPYVSEIESGKKEGSLSAMKRIAAALAVDLDDLV